MKDINDILAKHFSGEATPEEVKLVEVWKVENADEFKFLSEAWETADTNLLNAIEFKSFDDKTAWNKVDAQLDDSGESELSKETKIIRFNFYKKVAAACAIFLIGVSSFWFFGKSDFTTIANTEDSPKEIALPDGTVVWLASNASLDYKKDFENDRSLNLKGEAFFEVARDEKHPFIITTQFGNVEVLGTGFNVNATATNTLVSVAHGKVALSNKKGIVELTAGQSANATSENVTESQSAAVNFDAWQTGIFKFENTPLLDAVALLNKHYTTKIELDPAADVSGNLNGQFTNLEIEKIIEVIVLTCNVEAEHGDNVIRLK